MKALRKAKVRHSERHTDNNYYHDSEVREIADNWWFKSIYEEAQVCEEHRCYTHENDPPSNKIESLVTEIKIRIRITKLEIFTIGELLVELKKVCQENGTNFQSLITEKFDFSYETALNFMHVYTCCIGNKLIALDVPASILYKISAPSFPDELRESLFASGALKDIKNKTLQQLVVKYKKEGPEAIEQDIEKLSKGNLVIRQTAYTFDMCESVLRVLDDLETKIKVKSGYKYEMNVEGHQPVAAIINTRLYNAVMDAKGLVNDAVDMSKRELIEFQDRLKNAV